MSMCKPGTRHAILNISRSQINAQLRLNDKKWVPSNAKDLQNSRANSRRNLQKAVKNSAKIPI
jgi:NAD dependent epimerase/dehydratase family enzyme